MMKRLLFGLFACLLWSQSAWAQVALVSTATATAQPSGTSTVLSSVAIGATASDRLVFFSLNIQDWAFNGQTPTGVTINDGTSRAMTLAGTGCSAGGNNSYNNTYWILSTTGTTATFTITWSATITSGDYSIGYMAAQATGANTTVPVVDSKCALDGSSGSQTVTLTTTAGGAIVGGASISGLPVYAPAESFTGVSKITIGNLTSVTWNTKTYFDGGTQTGTSAGSTVVTESYSDTTNMFLGAMGFVSLQAAGGAAVSPKRTLMGVGQ